MAILYNVIKEQIDDWDPIGLLITHAPADEHDSESKKIFNKLTGLPSAGVEDLCEVIFDVFVKSFGDDVFISDKSECKKIAEKILTG